MYAVNKQELLDARPIEGIMWASACCGSHFSSPPTYEDEGQLYICEHCDRDCLITPAWQVTIQCPDHGEHDAPVPIHLYMQDGQN
jgi:hypothetical protein